ncbi:hypothetical protein [Marinobacter sp. F4216]|uniref:hypothetical protein n=1 Tax=Marinobacter sp. F4216 TaxID=2874281 RepID=UPI001CBCABB8|nr:hypothetical protein [Marinobacter sp. F4216]MBZ2168027.1 hypothetical protein [Marinobacter sp. F4216]
MEFIEAIRQRRKDVKFPTQRKFSVDGWLAHQDVYQFDSLRSQEIFKAGIFFFEVFEALRESLSLVEKNKPVYISQSDMRAYLCGLSNRHRKVLVENAHKQVNELMRESTDGTFYADHLHNIAGAALAGGGVLSLDDSAHQIVDNFTCVFRALHQAPEVIENKSRKPIKESEKTNVIRYLMAHEQLSSVYGIYEDYWNCLISEEVGFRDDGAVINLYPLINDENLAKSASFHRRSRHNMQKQQILYSIYKNKEGAGKGNSIFEKRTEKGWKYVSAPISSQSEEIQFANLGSIAEKGMVEEALSEKVVGAKGGKLGISVSEVIDYFHALKLISIARFNSLPDDTAVFKPGALKAFSVEVDFDKICRAFSRHFNHDYEKASEILNILKFSGDLKKDLWANPLIERNENRLLLLLAPFLGASLLRNSEIWAMQLGLDRAEKGFGYEKYLQEHISESIKRNDLLIKSEVSNKSKFKFSGSEEEIDLVLRVGDLVVIGEVKCIVTVDGPSSYRNSKARVYEAIAQIKRKRDFVIDNISYFLSSNGWGDIDSSEVTVQPIVLVSNYTFAGFSFEEVPILDDLLLSAYLRTPIIPMFSESGPTGTKHRLGARLYGDEDEAAENFRKYAFHPPQLQTIRSCVQTVEYDALVPIKGNSKRLKFGKLEVTENHDLESIESLDIGFDVVHNPTIKGF